MPGKTLRAAVIGYGMGRLHATYINENPDLDLRAICDLDPQRRERAAADFPAAAIYSNIGPMLRRKDIALATVAVPHKAHCRVATRCLRAGKHTIVEKPFCIRAAEADKMIAEARKARRVLTCYQNRRLDGDYMTIRQVVAEGLVGELFQVEFYGGAYRKPHTRWRSLKRDSGGALYDWGAHFVDWILGLVPANVAEVAGYAHKLVWRHVTNEDKVRALIRFANGAVGEATISSIDMVGRERCRILGTRGAITLGANNTLRVRTLVKGHRQAEVSVPIQESRWPDYYANIADHLLRGKDLLVKPREARRVVAVLEAATRSGALGKPLRPAYP